MQESYKLYVKVNADHETDGSCRPRSITLKNGAVFEIDRVRECCRAVSTKAGGVGIRYAVQILGRETYLFDEENGRWFIEARVPQVQIKGDNYAE